MLIEGFFYNQQGQKVSVEILTKGDDGETVHIGETIDKSYDDCRLYFADDPVEITSQVNDTFDHLLKYQARISLLALNYESGFYCSSCRDAVVNVRMGDDCIFAGYIEPQAYSQGYNEEYDEVELTCVDALQALQYSHYKNIGALGVSYALVKKEAQQRTWLSLLQEILGGVAQGLDVLGKEQMTVYYDQSKAVESDNDAHPAHLFEDLSISELLFLGDTEDDVWTQEDVLTELLKYPNLHIVQQGFRFYIFSWRTPRTSKTVQWVPILGGGTAHSDTIDTVELNMPIVTDCDTQITLGETYNRLLLTDKLQEMGNVVESPLDSDSLLYAYAGKQKYLTEYSADGEGRKAWRAIRDMVKDKATDFADATITDWFVQVKKCTNWKFYAPGKIDIIDQYCQGGYHQEQLPDQMGLLSGAAAILSVGKIQKTKGGNDNAPVSTVSMSDYLVISINGNGKDGEKTCYPSEATVKAAIPCAEYLGNEVGGVFSPADENTTNYIVISGKVVLNPLMPMTDTYTNMRQQMPDEGDGSIMPVYWHQTVSSRHNGDGRYYTRRHYQAENWRDEPTTNEAPDQAGNPCFIPYTEEGPQQYEFKYSGVGDATDNLSKVGVIACMLIIGDQCVVEKQPGERLGTSVEGTGNGQLTDYVWRKYKERSQCASDDEYYQQSFTVGFDPKIGDKIIGTEFALQNNLSYTQGVDAEGTAIPITKADKVHGKVRFIVLGPVNSVWNEVTRRHPSFWRHTKWSSNAVPLLSHVSNIQFKEFSVKVYSDNGKMGTVSQDNDIVYMSDTHELFVHKKDDLEMKITSALTSDECQALGVNNTLSISTPLNVVTQDSMTTLYDCQSKETAKPEQHYVNDYYQEWHLPRVVLNQSVWMQAAHLFRRYHQPTLAKDFYVQGYDLNLTEGTARMTLREVF